MRSASSPTEPMRPCGFFTNACSITSSSVVGIGIAAFAALALGGMGSLVMIDSRMVGPLLPMNGTVPVSDSYAMAATAQTSAR